MNKSKIILFLVDVIENGSDADLLKLYNRYTDQNLSIDEVEGFTNE
jgi:hypothetical protein